MVSVMQGGEAENNTGSGADLAAQPAPTIAGATESLVDGARGLGRLIISKVEGAVADVEDDARDLVLEAMRKLGAVHVAFDHLEVSLGSEIRNARDNVAAAIVSVARHLAG